MDSVTNKKPKIEDLLEENQKLLQEILVNTEKTRKYIFWGRVMTFIYLLIILAPIIFAIFYLPPLIEQFMGPYQELLSGAQAGNDKISPELINQIQDLLGN